ncbi:MAG: nitrous oxide reductase family maturation protein NosD [Microscillaceae bacterium]|jgi:nitrous oxidase accessory protein|nr:nitrous oxide reductase family maturation protein NosD [Microscillaceae bacterium]
MKKYLLILFFLNWINFTWAKTWQVCPTCELKSLKKTIALAQSGDTILVKKGIYKEGNLLINKQLVIIGEDYPILDGEKKYEIFTIEANNVTIQGLQIQNTGQANMNDLAGIKIFKANQVNIIANRLINTHFGIYLQGAENCNILNNEVKGNPTTEQNTGNGIHAWQCNTILIENNHLYGHRDGIYFEFVVNSQVKYNLSENNIRYGLHFMFSNDDAYYGNTFQKNGAGVAVMYTKRVKMQDNVFAYNWGDSAYGLLLKDISDSEIRCNTFEKNTVGIYMEGSSRIQIQENTWQENGWGLRIQASCADNVFKFNNFLGNSFDVATNGEVVMNTFSENYWDKYEGYDLNKDNIGDIPFHPVSMYSMVVEKMPFALMLMRSFMVYLLDKAEKVVPSLTPEAFRDDKPLMKSPLAPGG